MRNVISMAILVMLVTFLFCACGAQAQPVPAAEATVPPVTIAENAMTRSASSVPTRYTPDTAA